MKKLFILGLTVLAFCLLSNETFAQPGPNKIQDGASNSYVNPVPSANNSAAVKIESVKKQDLIDALNQRLQAVNASATLTAAQKQEQIEKIQAKLAELEN